MQQKAVKVKLKQGCQEEYKKRHEEIWSGLLEELKEAGIHEYSIFLDEETHILFAVQKLKKENSADRLPRLPGKEIVIKWWDHMADIMEVNADNSPVKPL